MSISIFRSAGVGPRRVAREAAPGLVWHDFDVGAAALIADKSSVLAEARSEDAGGEWGRLGLHREAMFRMEQLCSRLFRI